MSDGGGGFLDPNPSDFTVVWIGDGQQLILREEAGLAASEIAGVLPTQASIIRTGRKTTLGSSEWVQIETPSGIKGWVPSWNLTEDVPPEGFCADPRVQLLIDDLRNAISSEGAEELEEILSPKRGLVIRHDPWNPEVQIGFGELPGIFHDPTDYLWGTRYASQTQIRGSFSQLLVPALTDVLDSETRLNCNEIEVGSGAPSMLWPDDYRNLNLVSLHRPALENGNPFNWRTWVLAIEYVEGQPFIAVLVQIRPQV
jgi:hypothetical protein